jgi:hypothetical protein
MFPAPQLLYQPTLHLYAHWSSTVDQQMTATILLRYPIERKRDAKFLMRSLQQELVTVNQADTGPILLCSLPVSHLKLQVSIPSNYFSRVTTMLTDTDTTSWYSDYGIDGIRIKCSFDE